MINVALITIKRLEFVNDKSTPEISISGPILYTSNWCIGFCHNQFISLHFLCGFKNIHNSSCSPKKKKTIINIGLVPNQLSKINPIIVPTATAATSSVPSLKAFPRKIPFFSPFLNFVLQFRFCNFKASFKIL